MTLSGGQKHREKGPTGLMEEETVGWCWQGFSYIGRQIIIVTLDKMGRVRIRRLVFLKVVPAVRVINPLHCVFSAKGREWRGPKIPNT